MRASALQPLFVLSVCAVATQAATVSLQGTRLLGRDIPSLRQEFFAGIPYAQPPVGSLRLRPPVLKRSLKQTTFNATNYGPACIQTGVNVTAAMVSEDCLTINILRPAGIPANVSLPVMAWVYGGGFINGMSATYNGSAIVAKAALRGTPVIYVNFNYRTGPLGFPQGNDAAAQGNLNLGLKDQIAALQWIQANIGVFGGDKSKVTVFGESAGAISLAILMLNPDFKKLARAAILESGSWATTLTNYAGVREKDWEAFVQAVPQCAAHAKQGSFQCLQRASLNSSALLAATGASVSYLNEAYGFVPTYDGVGGVYPGPGSLILATGAWSKIPFITGCNKDEGTAFVAAPQYLTSSSAEIAITANFTPSLIPIIGEQLLKYNVQRLLQLYPNDPVVGAPFGTGNQTFGLNQAYKQVAALVTDISFHSQRRHFQQLAVAEGVKSFGYHFVDPAASPAPAYGVTHGTEVEYVYGACNPASQACQIMTDYWISFATSLDPNDQKGTSRPQWAVYSQNSPSVLQLNSTNTSSVPDTYRAAQIEFINHNALVWHQRSVEDN